VPRTVTVEETPTIVPALPTVREQPAVAMPKRSAIRKTGFIGWRWDETDPDLN
jgi:hypothetical protein